MIKEIIDQLVFSLTFLKYMEDFIQTTRSYLNISVDSEKGLAY